VEASPDPARARDVLDRLAEAHPRLIVTLGDDPTLVASLVAVGTASRSLFALLERDPVAVAMLGEQELGATFDPGEPLALARSEDPPRALRRWKHRELTRIAARDLLGWRDLRTVGQELAALADACLEAALACAGVAGPIAVVGMGKLGGQELNYASDVDVLFVHDGDQELAERAARAALTVMTHPSADGIVWRTDAALRPEGRAGALSRSLDAYTAYWEQWARPWERQALVKARPVAGDRALGDEFRALAEAFVWSELLDADAVREARRLKQRAEAEVARRGEGDRELKRSAGGIRDIEFTVQLLQLVHGRHDASLRPRATLDALAQLASADYVDRDDAVALEDAYVFFRTVEHRLQLVDEQQTHTLPASDPQRAHLARVLGFRDRAEQTALEALDTTLRRYRARTRAIHERVYFAPLLDTLAGAGALPSGAAVERLAAFGFRDVERTRAALQELTAGLTRRSRVMQQLLPVILGWLSDAPDPDLGLLQLRRLTEGQGRAAAVARAFRETPVAAERACRILGSSRVLGLAIHRHPDFLETLADDTALAPEVARDELVREALDTLDWREDEAGRRAGLRRFKRRHMLRVGARDVLGFADVATVGRELAALADASVEAALRSLQPPVPFTVVGLGRLGGGELSYASDLDVLFVFDGHTARDFEIAERIATSLVRAVGETTGEGVVFHVDPRLRPEGRHGPLARSLEGYATYYERWAEVWERQALTKARVVAGDVELGARFSALANEHSYRTPFPDEWSREIRRMKARIERERIPPGEDPRFHLKLGRGSLSDIEFTVQLLQLRHGVRERSTLAALEQLRESGVVDAQDADVLCDAFTLCERARNYRYLLTGTESDSLPGDDEEATRLGRFLGYEARPSQALRDDYRRRTRRAREVVERLFYERERPER
jgi:glutamate-ammonia-ligase adenylyltransferase